MKKLMIAAAAAMAGATTFGGLCDPDAAGPDSCSVYNIKFTFKTLAAKKACDEGAKWLVTDSEPGTPDSVWYRNSTADTAAAAAAGVNPVTAAHYIGTGLNACPIAGVIKNADKRWVYWMDNATRKFDGVAWQCKAACFEGWFADCDLNNNGRLNFVIWEKKTSLPISYPVFQAKVGENDGGKFKGTPETTFFSLDAQWSFDILGRYGNKAQKVAAYWDLGGYLLHAQTIDAAGFGTFDTKNLRTKSLSGNAVGKIMPIDEGKANHCGIKDKIFCALGFMCVTWQDWCCDGCYAGVELVPASGTWSLKYNASATKKANKDQAKLSDFVPSFMFYSTGSFWADARAIDPFLHTDGYYWYDTVAGGLFYREGAGVAGLTLDNILDTIAWGASKLINIYADGVFYPKGSTFKEEELDTNAYVYEGKKYEVDADTGLLPESVFTGEDDDGGSSDDTGGTDDTSGTGSGE